MTKKIIRSIIIFWGIVALFPLCYGIYYFTVGDGSFFIVADGFASAVTWLDSNADGLQSADEKPLADVCIWYGYGVDSGIREVADPCDGNHFSSDEQGKWWEFLPGGSCKEVFVFVRAPEGYHATTDLASDGCDARIGFVTDDVPVKQKVRSVEEFVRQQTILLWLKRVLVSIVIISIGIAGTQRLQKT